MGIIKLMNFIKLKFPKCIHNNKIQTYQNKILVIDAFDTMYKFLLHNQNSMKDGIQIHQDSKGNKTGHLISILNRNIVCMKNNILPIWVFEGLPPTQKIQEMSRRKQFKSAAQKQKTILISKDQNQDAKTMLKLLGMPIIQAPYESESQCAFFVKQKYAYATITQDMDTLTQGSLKILRNFQQEQSIIQINLLELLDQMKFDMDQFIDFCIICGCDYTIKIPYIGPNKAYKLISQLKKMQYILEYLQKKNASSYEKYYKQFNYIGARNLFKNPIIQKSNFEIKQNKMNQSGLRQFLLAKQINDTKIHEWLIKTQRI